MFGLSGQLLDSGTDGCAELKSDGLGEACQRMCEAQYMDRHATGQVKDELTASMMLRFCG